MNKLKRITAGLAAAVLSVTMAVTAFAAAYSDAWYEDTVGWHVKAEDGGILKNCWFCDDAVPGSGKKVWYLLDRSGKMVVFPLVRDGTGNYYSIETAHNGFYGMLRYKDGVYDGIYLEFDQSNNGSFGAIKNPEGLAAMKARYPVVSVADISNSNIVYSSSFASAVRENSTSFSGGSGGSSGGGGGGGGGSVTETWYSYSISYETGSGIILDTVTGKTVKNAAITIPAKEFDGYVYRSGAGRAVVDSNGREFAVLYDEDPDYGKYSYTVRYVEEASGSVLREMTGKARPDSTVSITRVAVAGYTAVAGNVYSFILSEDGYEHTLYYRKTADKHDFTISYMDGSELLGQIKGKAPEGSRIEVPDKDIPDYDFISKDDEYIDISSSDMFSTVHYSYASPSEETGSYRYTIRYVDRETDGVIASETFPAAAGAAVSPSVLIPGYAFSDDYEFSVVCDGEVFTAYLMNSDADDDAVTVTYTVLCIDSESGETVRTFSGQVSVGADPVLITPDYGISGYRRIGDNEFYVEKDGINEFGVLYERIREGALLYTIYCRDIDTGELIDTVELYGEYGQSIDIGYIVPDGYEHAGEYPERVTVSDEPANNYSCLYYKKVTDPVTEDKYADYSVHFVSVDDRSEVIKDPVTGNAKVGTRLPIYFSELYSSGGKNWKSVDSSPRTFLIKEDDPNDFYIYFKCIGEPVYPSGERVYSIRYIAGDTGSTLGIATGYSAVGSRIAYRNNFRGYGFVSGDQTSFTVSSDEAANEHEVYLTRTEQPGHTRNPVTGEYDGFGFTAAFIASDGTLLFPTVRGFSVTGDDFCIDFPETVERDGITYRSGMRSPMRLVSDGSSYRNFMITYEAGAPSDKKLEYWQQQAEEKKAEFYGNTPYGYFIRFREINSFNDIGVCFAAGKKDTDISIPSIEIPGYVTPAAAPGSFRLTADGMVREVSYARETGSSSGDYRAGYVINIVDADNPDNILYSLTGTVAVADRYIPTDIPVHFASSFRDREGSRWDAVSQSPQVMSVDYKDGTSTFTVVYRKNYTNDKTEFIVTCSDDVNRILNGFGSQTCDAQEHSFYLIGRDFDPSAAQVSGTLAVNDLAGYGCEKADTFADDRYTYIVSLITYHRTWEKDSCTHTFKYVNDVEAQCCSIGINAVRCTKCGYEMEYYVPAAGHIDSDHDSMCDRCSVLLKKMLGDEITVSHTDGRKYSFICIDTDYKGTGKQLYMAEDTISSGDNGYGRYTESISAAFSSSKVINYLDRDFAGGLSLYDHMVNIEGIKASLLTKAEYDAYKADAVNKYRFPEATVLTKGSTDSMMLTDGTEITAAQCDGYGIRPVILLSAGTEAEGTVKGSWHIGDMQAREIGGQIYLFRCVDTACGSAGIGSDLAFFMCDQMIESRAGLGYDEADGSQSTRFFGSDNNYKYSDIRKYLGSALSGDHDIVTVNDGVNYLYEGETEEGTYSSFTSSAFTRYKRTPAQYDEGRLFIPSLEEAIKYKDHLWCFNGSSERNAEEVITNYARSFWLRTPANGTSDMIYTVNLEKGMIEIRNVGADGRAGYSDIGIRPCYCVRQEE